MFKTNRSRAVGIVVGNTINQTVMATLSNIVTTILVVIAAGVSATTEQTVLIMTFASIGSMIGYAIAGPMVKKWNPKLLGFVWSLTIPLFAYSLAYAKSIYFIYITSALFHIAAPMCYLTVCQGMISCWVNKGRGVLMTLPWSIYSLINVFLAPVLVNMIQNNGREVIFSFGIIGFVLVAASCLLLFQKNPEEYGMEPADFEFKRSQQKKAIMPDEPYESAMPARYCFKTAAFYLIILVPMLTSFGYLMYYTNMSFILTNNGLDVTHIALTMSAMNIAAMITVPLFGATCDKIGLKWTYTLWCIPVIAGMLIVVLVKSFTGACIGMVLMSFVNAFSYFMPFAVAKLFGTKKVSEVSGWANSIGTIPSLFASVVCAAIANASGGYTLPIIIAVGLFVIDIFLCHITLSNKVAENLQRIDKPFKEKELENAGQPQQVSPVEESFADL